MQSDLSKIAIICHVVFFPNLHLPNNIFKSTESVAVHTHRSHTFSATVHYREEAWDEC